MKRWECLEAGCVFSVTKASDEDLVAAAQAHVRESHGSIELEEVILAGAKELGDGSH
jgi:predicted small metal-binding protein